MYPIPPGEHLVENRTCRQCSTVFPITDKDMEFYEKVSPSFPSNASPSFPSGGVPTIGGGVDVPKKKYLIPPPTLCPDCRQQRRLAFRNERKLYKRKCDATRKDIVSIYSPDKPYTVYHQDYWWSDAWDPMSYGREFDFTRSVIEQFGELMKEVPRYALGNSHTENSEFANYIRGAKNCYLSSVVYYDSEDIFYANRVYGSTRIIDSLAVYYSRNCIYCTDIKNCEDCIHCTSLYDCTSCKYSTNLRGCSNCIGCFGLINKSYHIMNQPVSEEEYRNYIGGESPKINIDELLKFLKNTIRLTGEINESEQCTGNYITNSQNCTYSFDIDACENCKYITGDKAINTQDGIGGTVSLSYEYSRGGWGKNLLFVHDIIESQSIYYSDSINFSHDLFLCTGLRNKSYCILNRQYTKGQYEELVPKIIEKMMNDGEWGEFFPASMSPFGYNETVAQEHFPMTREEVVGNSPLRKGDVTKGQGDLVSETIVSEQNPPNPLGQGGMSKENPETFIHGPIFNWSDYEAPFPKVEKIIPASKLPDSIEQIPDDILNWAIECEVTKKPFRIIKQELEFYRKHHLPIPKRHPDQRHLDRMKMRNPRKLFERKCDKCSKDMITTYAPERPETVYCEACYNKEVIG